MRRRRVSVPAWVSGLGAEQALEPPPVDYIIVGGVGARLQGSPYATGDLDIVPVPDPGPGPGPGRTLRALAAALIPPTA